MVDLRVVDLAPPELGMAVKARAHLSGNRGWAADRPAVVPTGISSLSATSSEVPAVPQDLAAPGVPRVTPR